MPAHALPDAPAEPDWPALHLHGSASAFRQSLALLQQCARVDATVLLCGETGTGKELAARALHYLSARSRGPFVPINCGALPDSILEAELFGHARGAFTDAKSDSLGVIGQAQGGTLFLDEIDAMSPRAQAAILRFAQDHSYRPLGASRLQHADVRLVAATNAKLEDLVAQGLFRQDLLFRINVLSVRLPPLRERHGDAALLAQAFVKRLVQQYRTDPKHIDAHSLALLQTPRAWPGNVRELEHLVHRAFLLAEGAVLHLDLGAPRWPHLSHGRRCTSPTRRPRPRPSTLMRMAAHRAMPMPTSASPTPRRKPSPTSSAVTWPPCCNARAATSAWPRASPARSAAAFASWCASTACNAQGSTPWRTDPVAPAPQTPRPHRHTHAAAPPRCGIRARVSARQQAILSSCLWAVWALKPCRSSTCPPP